MRISIDAAACMGHGRCYSLAPELFDSDDAGHAVALVVEVPPGSEDDATAAAQACPETAISVADAG